MTVTVVVPVWNGRELLARLLDTLDAQTLKPSELLVVDNGSSDGAPDLARARGARVLEMGRNAGFAPAVNRGIRESRPDAIAVLNSDVELAPDYLERLAAAGAWFATGKILRHGTKIIDGTFDALCRGACAWRVGSGRPDSALFSEPRAIASPPWTAALFRRELFDKVGLLDESYGSYLEDVDFGLRCSAAQITGIYEPRAVAWHRGSASLGRWHSETVRLIARNQVLLLARHYPRELLLRSAWHIAVAQFLWGVVALRHGRGFAWLRGKLAGLALFREVRRRTHAYNRDVLERLMADEREIRAIQESTGFDTYWRMYFLLTRGEAK